MYVLLKSCNVFSDWWITYHSLPDLQSSPALANHANVKACPKGKGVFHRMSW